MAACMYVRTYACMYMYVCMYVCMYAFIYTLIYMRAFKHVYICMYVCMYVCVYCLYIYKHSIFPVFEFRAYIINLQQAFLVLVEYVPTFSCENETCPSV